MNKYEAETERNSKRLQQARDADFSDLQMGLLTTIERTPGEVPANLGMGYPRELARMITEAFAPLLLTGLVFITESKMLELSEEGQALLSAARERRKHEPEPAQE